VSCPPAIDAYLEKAGAFRLDIDRMKNLDLTEGKAKELIYDAFANHEVIPLRLFPLVRRLYFDDEIPRARFQGRNLWSLNNAFTEAVKELRTVPQNSCGLKTGRFFGRIIHRQGRGVEPVLGEILPAETLVVNTQNQKYFSKELRGRDPARRRDHGGEPLGTGVPRLIA
jgi:hypothetical protein